MILRLCEDVKLTNKIDHMILISVKRNTDPTFAFTVTTSNWKDEYIKVKRSLANHCE